jgi:hypothetical protein
VFPVTVPGQWGKNQSIKTHQITWNNW